MLDKRHIGSKSKRGISILLTTVVLSTALFLVFGTVKFLEMTDLSLRLTYIAMQTVQKGRLQIPSEQLALESMAVVARVNGFSDAKPTEGPQRLRDGDVNFSYDIPFSTTPVVRAYYSEGSGLLSGLFRGFSSSSDPGIVAEQAQSALAGGISNGATLVYADLSDSMRGPNYTYGSGDESRISELLRAYGFSVIAGPRDGGTTGDPIWGISTGNPYHMCWPIDISACVNSAPGLSNKTYTRARQCCNAARQNLPGYVGGTIVPPGRPYRPGWHIGDPQSQVAVDVDYMVDSAAPPGGYPLTPYNPGLPASSQDDPTDSGDASHGELRLVCNTSVNNINQTITIASGPHAGTYGPFPNYPGFRVGDFDLSTCLNNGRCERFTEADNVTPTTRFTNDQITDRLLCVEPWHYWKDWRLDRETAPWVGTTTASELQEYGGFSSQLGLLAHLASDFFITYKRLTEAFLIGISEFNSNLVFSVFGGANPFGAIQTAGSNPQSFMSGNYELYNGFNSAQDIEHQPIDITDTLTKEVPNSGSPNQRIWTAMNLVTGYYRSRFIAHLDQAHFPNLNPGENTPYPFSTHIWPGSEYLMALKNPNINRPKGQSLPWGLESPALSPAAVSSFFNLYTVDLTFGNTVGVDMFPNGPRPVVFFPLFTMSPRFLLGGSHDLTWWPLKAVSNTGIQSAQDMNVPKVLTYARELFGHGLGPMMGGTHLRSVVKHMNDQADAHGAETGGITGRRWFSIIVTDGKPNEPEATQAALNAAYPSVAPFIQPAPPISYTQMRTEIVQGLQDFESKVPALTILLFIEHSPPDAETQDFLDQFDPSKPANAGNYKRALFKINYQNVNDFKEKYKQALTFISILLKSSTKFVQ